MIKLIINQKAKALVNKGSFTFYRLNANIFDKIHINQIFEGFFY